MTLKESKVEPRSIDHACRTVLVVDDEPSVRQVISILLERDGIKALPARDGSEALEVLSAHDIQAVITDLSLPGIRGDELAIRIKERFDLPVLLISGYGSMTVEMATLAGVDAIVEKPLGIGTLRATLETVMRAWGENDSTREA